MRVLVALAAAVLTISAHATPVAMPCSEIGSSCPMSSDGWTLFADSNRRVPDFWLDLSLAVQEIVVCRHGISFLFEGRDQGNLYEAALVFVNPSGEAWGNNPSGNQLGMELDAYQEQYSTLLQELDRLAGGALGGGGRIDFRKAGPDEQAKIIRPMWRLVLSWRGREIRLRGYLDVYLNSLT